jgi:hypothetical protein
MGEIDGECERLLLALGYCGGGVTEILTGNFETILPLADDCLTFLLGSVKARALASRPPTFFLTEGWLMHENNIVASFEKSLKDYDRETALNIQRIILGGYTRLGFLDTGAYDLNLAFSKALPMAEALGLEIEALPVDLDWMNTFLKGPYDDPTLFFRLPPKSRLRFGDWNKMLFR